VLKEYEYANNNVTMACLISYRKMVNCVEPKLHGCITNLVTSGAPCIMWCERLGAPNMNYYTPHLFQTDYTSAKLVLLEMI
jgi:hypothetical protein